jgi:hypothetical protein
MKLTGMPTFHVVMIDFATQFVQVVCTSLSTRCGCDPCCGVGNTGEFLRRKQHVFDLVW